MLKEIRPAIVMIVAMTIIAGLIYPLGMTGIAQARFSVSGQRQIDREGRENHGLGADRQNFTDEKYFHGRPSATTDPDPNNPTKTVPAPYNAANSGGSDARPDQQGTDGPVKEDAEKLQAENPNTPIPADLVTASASGLDPDITPAGALFQVPRIAKARGLKDQQVRQLVEANTEGRFVGVIGEPRVNV